MPPAPQPPGDTLGQGSAANGEPRFTDWLREQSEPTWTQAVEHRFTRELADETLDDAVFRRYLVQDYSFVDRFVGLLGMDFAKIIESFDARGVAEKERTNPELKPPTRGFHELMKEAWEAGGYEEILAVLVVAEWVYVSWATAVKDRSPSKFYFSEWIDLHANDEFRDFVDWLRGQLDAHGPALSPDRREAVVQLFRRAVRLEKEFFDAAYEDDS